MNRDLRCHAPGISVLPGTPAKSSRSARRTALWAALVLTSGLVCPAADAQANEWEWVGGNRTPATPVYGTEGSASPTNLPGARYQGTTWTDAQGNFWMFGGYGDDENLEISELNDLWKYAPGTNQWEWVSGASSGTSSLDSGNYGILGVPAPTNLPPGRYGASGWTDSTGNLWLFGGYQFNDLWEYSPATNEWTWTSGSQGQSDAKGVYGTLGLAAPGAVPGNRMSAAAWTDGKGNLWLFGGAAYDANSNPLYNDLWMYNPTAGVWTWMGGSNSNPTCEVGYCGAAGVYGTQGAPSTSNIPGARSGSATFTTRDGRFWLYGGEGLDSNGTMGTLNDLWAYDPANGTWTWMSGDSTFPSGCASTVGTCGFPGVYGTLQVPDNISHPSSRGGATAWSDSKGNLWMFGGSGYELNSSQQWEWGESDDLWMFNPATNQWEWMSGGSSLNCSYYPNCGQPGIYGTLQMPNLGNNPPGRQYAQSWIDNSGNLWLFGGSGVDITGWYREFQDVWEFQPNTNSRATVAAPVFSPTPGTYTTTLSVTIDDATQGASISYLINGATPAIQYTGAIAVSASQTIEAIASSPGLASSNIATGAYTLQASPTAAPAFNPPSGTYSDPQSVTITDATPGASIYYTTDGSLPTAASAVYSGPISVSSSQTIQAIAAASGLPASPVASAVYTVGGASSLGEWTWIGGSSQGNLSGSYGTLAVPAARNLPGARTGAVTWTDQSGNLWLFGGAGVDAVGNLGGLNDLWEYNPVTGLWAWMSGSNTITNGGSATIGVYGTLGSFAPGNTPGGRAGAAGWADSAGHFWLFGGAEDVPNDLWQYDPSIGQWAWMGGSNSVVLSFYSSEGQPGIYGELGVPSTANVPGSREHAASWVDHNGNFWLFGGTGQDAAGDSVELNDLWEYVPSSGEWAWMSGSNVANPDIGTTFGSYGTLGVPSPANTPGGRDGAAAWTDANGDLWLFGGSKFNDLWRYNIAAGTWTWMNGSSTPNCFADPLVGGFTVCVDAVASYGMRGVPAPGNTPAGGGAYATWTDKSGNFWLMGGVMPDVTGEFNGLYLGISNDLWMLNPATVEWAWMGGDYATSNCEWVTVVPLGDLQCAGPLGDFGTQGAAAVGNAPGARMYPATWVDKSGDFWLFSADAGNLQFNEVMNNDLWTYQPSPVTLPAAASPIFSLIAGTYIAGSPLIMSNGMSAASIYYTTDGSTPTPASNLYTGPITLNSTETLQAMATAPGYRNSGVNSVSYQVVDPPAVPVFSPPSGTYTSVQSVTLTDSTAGTSIGYNTDPTVSSPNWTTYTGPITVSSSGTLGAVAAISAPASSVLDGIAIFNGGYVDSSEATATYTINLPPPSFNFGASPSSLTVSSGGQGNVTLTVTPQNGFSSTVSFACSGLPTGASCTFNPSTVTPSGSAATTKLTITAETLTSRLYRNFRPLLSAPILVLGLCALGSRKRRSLRLVVLCALAFAGWGVLSGCGGSSGGGGGDGGGGKTAVTSTITMTATSGSLQQTATITLTVD